MSDSKPNQGDPVVVKIKGVPVKATYLAWSEQYNLAVVDVGGKKLYRKLFNDLAPKSIEEAETKTAKVENAKTEGAIPGYGRCELHSDGLNYVFDSLGRLKTTFSDGMYSRRTS